MFNGSEALGCILSINGDEACRFLLVAQSECGGAAAALHRSRCISCFQISADFQGSFLTGHNGSRVETKARIIAGDETNTVEVMAWKTEVGVERYEGPK